MKGRMGSSITAEISQAEVRAGLVSKCFQRKVSRLRCQITLNLFLNSRIRFHLEPFKTI